MLGGCKRLVFKKTQSFVALQAKRLGGFFIMYTQAQITALKKYKKALQEYNEGKIEFKEYVEIILPLWDEINILFDNNQKTS